LAAVATSCLPRVGHWSIDCSWLPRPGPVHRGSDTGQETAAGCQGHVLSTEVGQWSRDCSWLPWPRPVYRGSDIDQALQLAARAMSCPPRVGHWSVDCSWLPRPCPVHRGSDTDQATAAGCHGRVLSTEGRTLVKRLQLAATAMSCLPRVGQWSIDCSWLPQPHPVYGGSDIDQALQLAATAASCPPRVGHWSIDCSWLPRPRPVHRGSDTGQAAAAGCHGHVLSTEGRTVVKRLQLAATATSCPPRVGHWSVDCSWLPRPRPVHRGSDTHSVVQWRN